MHSDHMSQIAQLAEAIPVPGSGVTLPTQLLYTSSAQTYPYLFCESAGSAATAMKSRNNLQRGGSSSNLLNSS